MSFFFNLFKPWKKRMQFNSQASQDRFVYFILNKISEKCDCGYYLEIGAAHPIKDNNTYFFEKNLDWKGVSLDICNDSQSLWNSSRKNSLLIEDATQSDYESILASFPQNIDYLSLDIDGSYEKVLQKLISSNHTFKVITIEHDFWRFGDKYRKGERDILASAGYHLLCPDVSVFFDGKDVIFEDWWVHPNAFPADLLSKLKSLDLKAKNHDKIIKAIQKLMR